jgi:hypothetical protein
MTDQNKQKWISLARSLVYNRRTVEEIDYFASKHSKYRQQVSKTREHQQPVRTKNDRWTHVGI